jgi:hypothetical protein
MDIPISNLDLKIGDSIIGEEILSNSSLQDILESHVSITNPLIVNASITNLQQCILLFCYSYGLAVSNIVADHWLYQGQEEEHAVAILIVGILIWFKWLLELVCRIYIIGHLVRLSGKKSCKLQLQYFMAGFAKSIILEFFSLSLRSIDAEIFFIFALKKTFHFSTSILRFISFNSN